MNIVRQITAGVVIASIGFSNIEKSNANPVVLAPAALCAGTAGVGCIVVGTVLIGGTIYYIWQLSNGKRVRADAYGRVLQSDYLEDPEQHEEEVVFSLRAKSKSAAEKECAFKVNYEKFKVYQKNGKWYCEKI